MSKAEARAYFRRIYGSFIPFDQPVHHGYTIHELCIIVAAVAYEVYDEPITSDSSYDRECKTYADSNPLSDRNIESFDESTGMWVHQLIEEEGAWVTELTEDLIEVTKWMSKKGVLQYHHPYLLYCIAWEPE